MHDLVPATRHPDGLEGVPGPPEMALQVRASEREGYSTIKVTGMLCLSEPAVPVTVKV